MSSNALPLLTEDQTLGRYELLTPIGRGGMATVWAARLRGSHGFSKVVAIKTMLPVLSSDPRFEQMFLAEAQIAARIDHPNVCEILDVGEDRGVVYLVMNWVDGESLAALASTCSEAARSIPPAVAARIVAQAARGLHAAHVLQTESGTPCPVIHRDVSPQNILVTCAGVVTIVDFGVARAAERSEHTTEAGFIKGKVAYLAPEQIEGRDIDVRVDVFALGVVLYELVSGKHPFAAETDLATLLAIAAPDPAPPLPEDEHACPAALRAIVERTLAKDPDKRYASMRELATALETFAAGVENGTDDVSAFVTLVLGAERKKRAKELREAVRSADLRREQREADTGRALSARPGALSERPEARRSMGPPARRRALLFAAIGITGIGLGAMGLRASQVAGTAKLTSTATPTPALTLTATATATPALTPALTASAIPSAGTSAAPTTSTSTTKSAGPLPAGGGRGAARNGSSARPAASASSGVKKGPLDSWD